MAQIEKKKMFPPCKLEDLTISNCVLIYIASLILNTKRNAIKDMPLK